MKQTTLFSLRDNEDNKYTTKVETPLYIPRGKKPSLLELIDKTKTSRLIFTIEKADVSFEEKQFLIDAARRHNVFNYEAIADYYCNASPQMQCLMELSGLVIIDFNKAIELGYVKLSEELHRQYLTDYNGANDETE